jgi:predicted alpha/beta hydrolase family esterase
MKRVFVVHGYTGYPDKNWFPWLKRELEAMGMQVSVPALPNTESPALDEWLDHLAGLVGQPDEDTFLVGHSLGCATILRYLGSLEAGQKIGGALLVAAFAEPISLSQLDGFTAGEWDYEAVKTAASRIEVINSDNDPYIPIEMAYHIRDRFGANLEVLHAAGHINQSDGYTELPVALNKLKEMMGL